MKLRPQFRTSLSLCVLSLLVLALVAAHIKSYETQVQHSREAVLRMDLRAIRDAIDNYTLGKGEPPHSLQDLVDAGYLRSIPMDLIKHKPDWLQDFEGPVLGDPVLSPDLKAGRLIGVHSNSNAISRDGNKYNEW